MDFANLTASVCNDVEARYLSKRSAYRDDMTISTTILPKHPFSTY